MAYRNRLATPEDPTVAITPQMEIVIDRLMAGDTVVAAAAAAGVDRTTVHRWKREHWAFQAELNRRRRELHERLQLRLETLAERAVDNIVKAVDAGDLKASQSVLDRLALPPAAPPDPQSENPEYLRTMAEQRELDLRLMGIG